MWVSLSDGFVSIVAHREKPGVLLVRGRRVGDVQRLFPEVTEAVTPRADYLVRAEVPVQRVQEVMAAQVAAIGYENFKGSVADQGLRRAFGQCWAAMVALQRRAAGRA